LPRGTPQRALAISLATAGWFLLCAMGQSCGADRVPPDPRGDLPLPPLHAALGAVNLSCMIDKDSGDSGIFAEEEIGEHDEEECLIHGIGGIADNAPSASSAAASAAPAPQSAAAPKGAGKHLKALGEESADLDGRQPLLRLGGSAGGTYEGEWRAGLRHGFGVQRWSDGASYVGEWQDNVAEGRGRFTDANGDYYLGEWRANAAHGLGTSRSSASGSTYRGEWSADKPEGVGTEVWDEGYSYEGSYKAGKRHGPGVFWLLDGSTLRGCWEHNCTSGVGEHISNSCTVFQGRWRGTGAGPALLHGPGHYIWEDGRSYRGQFVTGQRHGFGLQDWPDGRTYEGYWRGGRQHGYGWYLPGSDQIFRLGYWSNGRMQQTNTGKAGLKAKNATSNLSERLFCPM